MKHECVLAVITMIVGLFGFLGVIGCGASVVAWTLALGQPQNYVGATLVAFLCICACLCCLLTVWLGCLSFNDNMRYPLKD
jgi:hypothetical protein